MIFLDAPQGSPMWHAQRVGYLTTSEFSKIITPAKLTLSTQVFGYLNDVLAAWILGQPPDEEWAGSSWTDRGNELEAEARMAFGVATGMHPQAVGFIRADGPLPVGTSLDSLVLDKPEGDIKGANELKCPKLSTHIGYWRTSGVPHAYRLQTQGQLWVTGLDHGWFQSYHPDGGECIRDVVPDPRVQDALSEHIPLVVEQLRELQARHIEEVGPPRDPLEWALEQEPADDEWGAI